MQASDTGCYRFCSGYLWVQSSSSTTGPQQFLRDFVKAMMPEDGSPNWPSSKVSATGSYKLAPKTNDNAKAVATDLVSS
ncbi:hypothetical protein [Anaplasma phagocytophilum]|uniref:hypothetical protein n=1 Tax=Anaplasma phagocytophilum TaxID=948 RepID=UPI0012BD4081|nr:hypothetical protein [Anaplasma phagocytophilum]